MKHLLSYAIAELCRNRFDNSIKGAAAAATINIPLTKVLTPAVICLVEAAAPAVAVVAVHPAVHRVGARRLRPVAMSPTSTGEQYGRQAGQHYLSKKPCQQRGW